MIVLVSGYRRSGKDFFASHGPQFYEFCVAKYNPTLLDNVNQFTKLKFATPLAKLVPVLFNVTPEQYESAKDDPQAIEDKGTVRDYLIAIAREVRQLDEDFFARRVAQDISGTYDNYIITDWRYLNEYWFLEKMFPGQVITVRIERQFDGDGPFRIPDGNIASEHALDHFDFDFILKAVPPHYPASS